ncbi:MAG: sigma-70 family RNA polymerase sigma factor [Gemmatimonadota bacterium]|jgi:RNA polymerase sigma-70 factor (ECF subfamily)|nr:sigma-70 family RNA polymerase sigma factor [Candidatus Palauibacterales bacterium]
MGAAVIEAEPTRGEGSEAPSPEDTVRRAQRGDATAFERLYQEHHTRIYALCLRMMRDADLAEELTQDVFVRLYERLSSFRGASSFATWLHRLAVNVVLNHLRSGRRRAGHEQKMYDAARYKTAVKDAMPETRMTLETAIAELPPGAREVLVLHDIEGYRYREIAEVTGTAVGTVKSQLHRARKLLREVLER